MFIKENKDLAANLARICHELKPDIVYINTPLRPSIAKPLSKAEISKIKRYFKGMKVFSVYSRKHKNIDKFTKKRYILKA